MIGANPFPEHRIQKEKKKCLIFKCFTLFFKDRYLFLKEKYCMHIKRGKTGNPPPFALVIGFGAR